MASKFKSNDAGPSNMLKRSHKTLLLSEKVKVLDIVRKEKNCMQRLLRYTVRTYLLHSIITIMKKEKEINTGFAVADPTAKIMNIVHDKCLVQMEEALNSWVENMKRK